MPSAKDALLRYEAGQTAVAISALTDSGNHIAFTGSASPWSRRDGYAPVIRPNGLLTGGAVTPAASGLNDAVDVAADPEGHLLELSTAMDISGRQTNEIPVDFRADVLARYPRLGLPGEFTGYFENQAARKPGCLAARFVREGFAARVAANPLDRPGAGG